MGQIMYILCPVTPPKTYLISVTYSENSAKYKVVIILQCNNKFHVAIKLGNYTFFLLLV